MLGFDAFDSDVWREVIMYLGEAQHKLFGVYTVYFVPRIEGDRCQCQKSEKRLLEVSRVPEYTQFGLWGPLLGI